MERDEEMKDEQKNMKAMAYLAHDFCSPLNACAAALQMMRMIEENPSAEWEKYYRMISHNLHQMVRITDQYTSYYRLAHQDLSMTSRIVNISDFLFQIHEGIQECFSEDVLQMKLDAAVGCLAVVDVCLLEQAFWNLITNSVQATKERPCKINVSVSCREEYVVLSVQDFGCGIEPDKQEKIFTPSYQTGVFRKGAGLGLPLVREIMDRHHGRVTLESRPGKGSTFSLWFPQAAKVEGGEKRLRQRGIAVDYCNKAQTELGDFLA